MNNFKIDDFPEFANSQAWIFAFANARAIVPFGSYETSEEHYDDVDIMVLMEGFANREHFRMALRAEGWELDDNYGEHQERDFDSYKKNYDGKVINLVVYGSLVVFYRYEKGANLAKALNLTSKEDRILVHDLFVRKRVPRTIQRIKG